MYLRLVRADSMVDVVDPVTRSRMSACRKGQNMKPEIIVHKALFAAGFRFLLHRKDLLGRRVAMFVQGCFWHAHLGCRYATTPASRRAFWEVKLATNVEQDVLVIDALLSARWRALVVWEYATRSTEVRKVLPELLRC